MYCQRCGTLMQDGSMVCQRCGWTAQPAQVPQQQAPPPAPQTQPPPPPQTQPPPAPQPYPTAQPAPPPRMAAPYPPPQMAMPYAPPPQYQQGTPVSTYLMGGLICSVVAGLLVLFTEFAGSYWNDGYVEGWVDVWMWTTPGLILLLPLGLVFLAAAGYASSGMRDPRYITVDRLSKARNISVGATVWVFVDAIIFVALAVGYDWDEWWFESGFYGGAIGGILSVIFFQMAVNQARATGYPAQAIAWPAPGQPQPYQYPTYAAPPPQAAPPPAQYAPPPPQQQQWPGQQQPPYPPPRP